MCHKDIHRIIWLLCTLVSWSHGFSCIGSALLQERNQITHTSLHMKDALHSSFDDIVQNRYACTRYQRNDNSTSNPESPTASKSSPQIVQMAKECLNLARRSPSGFNSQPYRLLIVSSVESKEKLAKYCLGRNADRIRDSDCSVVFLADKECWRDYKRFASFLDESTSFSKKSTKWPRRKLQALVLLFSSGWPFPRILSNPLSFLVRCAVSVVSVLSRRNILVPSLATSDTWASKNTMLVAMTYMLACTSKGLNTTPMEGYNVGGIRKALNIPRRYSIPLIVSTGLEYQRKDTEMDLDWTDDAGMEHGSNPSSIGTKDGEFSGSSDRTTSSSGLTTPRYPVEDIIFENEFRRINHV
jgi:nitroreductase